MRRSSSFVGTPSRRAASGALRSSPVISHLPRIEELPQSLANDVAWYRGFGERPLGFWSKEFQLAEGRPQLHLVMKGPESTPDPDYRGFQMLTRLGNQNARRNGKHPGTVVDPADRTSPRRRTATEMLRWWSQIVTDGSVENHARRGVNVRTVFFAKDDQVATKTRRAGKPYVNCS
jgi:hypothetical protein